MITTHEATKYENYLPVDDLLAPVFSYERVKSFFFFTFRTVSRICDYIRSIQKMETSNIFLFYFFLFSCPPSGNFRIVIPEMYRESSPIGWTIREFVLQEPSGDIDNSFRATLREKRGRQPASHKFSRYGGST